MVVKINGRDSEIAEGLTVRDLVIARKLPDKAVIVELNGEVLRRELWESTQLKPGDRLELIRILGGG